MKFAFVDTSGQVMAVQETPSPPAPTTWETDSGYTRVEVPAEIEVNRDVKLTYSDGVATASTPSINPVQPNIPYDELRRGAYPPVGDQLDMIYRDLKAAAIEGEFTAAVEAVKTLYPKT